jgi:hypothetical protein
MELELEVFSHLVKCGVLEGGLHNPSHKIFLDSWKVVLDKETSILFDNGIAIAKYLVYIKRRLEAQVSYIKYIYIGWRLTTEQDEL